MKSIVILDFYIISNFIDLYACFSIPGKMSLLLSEGCDYLNKNNCSFFLTSYQQKLNMLMENFWLTSTVMGW